MKMYIEEQYNMFLHTLINATGNISVEYFKLPVANMEESIYRERVYCYELYHQMKLILPNDFKFSISGEVDKIRHPIIKPGCGRIIPDFLVHKIGEMENDSNLVIMEVKSIDGAENNSKVKGLLKDIKTINCMTSIKNGYFKGVILIYGNCDNDSKIKIIDKVKNICIVDKVHLVFHEVPGTKAELYKINAND